MQFSGKFIDLEVAQKDFLASLEEELRALPESTKIGAITTFTGIVREISDKSTKEVIGLEVEHWEEYGDARMTEIATRIGKEYGLLGIRIVHVYGHLKIGDPIVFVSIASIHRKEAFEALESAIIAYKNESPVWKKEIYADGSGTWIKTAGTSK